MKFHFVYSCFLLLVGLTFVQANAQQSLYTQSFEQEAINQPEYSAVTTANANIGQANWSNDGVNLAFTAQTGNNGSNALGLSINGSSVFKLKLSLLPGTRINLTHLNFWGKKSMANMDWTLLVNGTQVATGNTTTAGGMMSATPIAFSQPMNDLSGNIAIRLEINGNGNGVYSLDDFSLYGSACPPLAIAPVNTITCEGTLHGLSLFSIQPGVSFASGYDFQWQVNSGGTYVDMNDNGIYFGTSSSTLLFPFISIALDGTQYLCEVTNTSTGCTYTFGPFTLAVYPTPPPITINYN